MQSRTRRSAAPDGHHCNGTHFVVCNVGRKAVAGVGPQTPGPAATGQTVGNAGVLWVPW